MIWRMEARTRIGGREGASRGGSERDWTSGAIWVGGRWDGQAWVLK
jgi:hypothetical protein